MFGLNLLQPIALVVAVTALLGGIYWAADAIGDAREAQVRAEIKAERAAEKEAERVAIGAAGEAAEAARRGALLPGAVARLRADWCRDCEAKP